MGRGPGFGLLADAGPEDGLIRLLRRTLDQMAAGLGQWLLRMQNSELYIIFYLRLNHCRWIGPFYRFLLPPINLLPSSFENAERIT
jgi:hypothetical protein